MPSKQVNALAARGLEIKAEAARLENELRGINSQLIEAGAQTIELTLGRVIITQPTHDRPSSTFDFRFDKEKFLALPTDHPLRIDIMSSGLGVLEQGVTKGRPSVVQYSLKNVG
jgi:hypothetical protein